MDLLPFEPNDGDVVVVRASNAPVGRPLPGPDRFAVVEWGKFKIVSDRLGDLSHDQAAIEARLCAAERGRDAWDSTGPTMLRIRRLPLVYRSAPNIYSISVDVTDYTNGRAMLQWKSTSHLSEKEVRALLVEQNDVPLEIALALIGKAPMPEACV
jgi:hypothetical protein